MHIPLILQLEKAKRVTLFFVFFMGENDVSRLL